MERKQIRRALISVYDKSGLVELGKFLSENGVTILSTGSTAKQLIDGGITVTPVENYTDKIDFLVRQTEAKKIIFLHLLFILIKIYFNYN